MFLALGVFIGNFAIYSIVEKNPAKGFAIGVIAAIICLIFAPLLGIN